MIKKVADSPKEQSVNLSKHSSSPQSSFADRLSRNLALAALLLIGIVSVRNEQLPSGATVMAAIQDTVHTDWDESLGKISFVSNLFPETVSVFFDSSPGISLVAPCFGTIAHSWNKNEPYISYQAADQRVYASAHGQVMSLAHGINEEKILRIRHDNGVETLYYHLENTYVNEGDYVTEATCIGESMQNEEVVWEVRRNGISTDPADWLMHRSEAAL